MSLVDLNVVHNELNQMDMGQYFPARRWRVFGEPVSVGLDRKEPRVTIRSRITGVVVSFVCPRGLQEMLCRRCARMVRVPFPSTFEIVREAGPEAVARVVGWE